MFQDLGFWLHARRLEWRLRGLSLADPSGVVPQRWRESTNSALTDAFFELCERAGVATLIECGAHEAAASVRFLQTGTDRTAIAVEANPHTFQTLTAKAAEHGVQTLQVAVGASSGIGELNIPTSNANVEASELAASDASLRLHRKWDQKRKAIRTVPVQVTTLDELAGGGGRLRRASRSGSMSRDMRLKSSRARRAC